MKTKSVISFLLVLTLLFTGMTTAFAANGSQGTTEHWSKAALRSAVANGLLDEDDARTPDAPITRVQFADMLVRAYGAFMPVKLSGYSDIVPGSAEEKIMSVAVQMGAFKGDGGKLYPNRPITREEACLVMLRLLRVAAPENFTLDGYADAGKISPWARTAVLSMVYAGYLSGDGVRLNPTGLFTCGEAAQIFDNLFQVYIREPGVYTSLPEEGSVMISVTGVTLRGVSVDGMIVVGDGVGDGECFLEDVTLSGITMVRGGGPHTVVAGVMAAEDTQQQVVLLPDSDGSVGQIAVTNAGGTIVLNNPNFLTAISSFSQPPSVPVYTPPTLLAMSPGSLSGQFSGIIAALPTPPPNPSSTTSPAPQNPGQPAGPGTNSNTLTLNGAQANTLNVVTPNSQVNMQSGTINSVNIAPAAQGTTLNVGTGATVNSVNANAHSTVAGGGTVGSVAANANNVTVNTNGTTVSAAPGTTGVTAGGARVAPGTSGTTPPIAPPVIPSWNDGPVYPPAPGLSTASTTTSQEGTIVILEMTGSLLGAQADPEAFTLSYYSSLALSSPDESICPDSAEISGNRVYLYFPIAQENFIRATVCYTPTGTLDLSNGMQVSGFNTGYLVSGTSNANLSSLLAGNEPLADFNGENTIYQLTVSANTGNIEITATTDELRATLRINGAAPADHETSDTVTLDTGSNTVIVEVTATDGTTKTYTITVIREA